MGIGKPLCRAATHSRDQTDVCAKTAATKHQFPMAEGILDALHDSAELRWSALARDAGPLNRQIDDLWNGEESDGDAYQ